MKDSKIEWTDHTFNIMWGCEEVFGADASMSACLHCYAREQAKRYGFDIWGPNKPRRFFGEAHWNEPLKWNRFCVQHRIRDCEECPKVRVFCSSMSDVFEDYSGPSREDIERHQSTLRARSPIFKNVILGGRKEMDEARARLWNLIDQTPNLFWQLLTKRPENMIKMTPDHWQDGWPSNVIAMTTVENQAAADERIPHLLEVPAKYRGLSCEPQLEHINLQRFINRPDVNARWPSQIDWIINGGESGPKKRPFNCDFARGLRDQCKSAGAAYFFKQVDKVQPIPADLMIREFPV